MRIIDDIPYIEDLFTHQWIAIAKPGNAQVVSVLFETVLVKDELRLYKFRIGDAKMSGISIPEDKTLSGFVEEQELTQDWFEICLDESKEAAIKSKHTGNK